MPRRFDELTWPEVERLDPARTVALLPVGAVEAHGPHLPLATDLVIAEAMARAAARRLEGSGSLDVLLLPTLPYGAALARTDARYRSLVEGLRAPSLGRRMAAIQDFFESFDPGELSRLELPPNLSQLRFIYLSSHPDWPSGS